MDKLYTIKEATGLLKISKANLYRLIAGGNIQPVKLGGRTLFTESELDRFIENLKKQHIK
jgi:excisionase family DNA binding protein